MDEKSALGHDWQWYGGETFSQHGEDLVIVDYFHRLGITPSYLDIGSFDPFLISNTYLLYKRGARGINIDANVSTVNRFKAWRPNDINLHFAVVPGLNESTSFFTNPEMEGRSSILEDQVRGLGEFSEIKVPAININKIIEIYSSNKWPEFFSIDIEGLDFEILKSANFLNSRPNLICVEAKTSLYDDSDKIRKLMLDRGFTLYLTMGSNVLFSYSDNKRG